MTRKTFLGLAGVLLVGCLLAGASLITEKCIPKTEWDGGQYRIENVNALDAHFAQPYDKLRDDVGTVLVLSTNAAAYCTAVLLVFLGVEDRKKALRMMVFDSFTYGECCLYTSGIYHILKTSVGRIRPYMYFPDPSVKGIAEGDFCLSWPSGHSSLSLIAFAFMLGWFALRFPASRLRKPSLCVFLMLGLATMTMRMLSGNHFLTDVLSGAALGFLVSTLVFRVNNRIWVSDGMDPGQNPAG